MPAVLPGKSQAKLQAISVGRWQGQRIIAYISGNALVTLNGPHSIIQTIYDDSGEPLEAVALDERSGKLAVCSARRVRIYAPDDETARSLKWSLHRTTSDVEDVESLTSLSWGATEEILLGGSSLSIFSTSESISRIWTKRLANPAKLASYSGDATLIASTGRYDKLVKVWRRRTFSANELQFDFAYLPHPTTVTGFNWRKSFDTERNGNNVLYTNCADQVFRIWTGADGHSLQILDLCRQIDLRESIKPRGLAPKEELSKRYVFVLDKDGFTSAVQQSLQRKSDSQHVKDVQDHLEEVAHCSPDVCVVLDDEGRMSAWGMTDIAEKSKHTTNVFNIAHVDGVKLAFQQDASIQEDYLQVHAFCGFEIGSGLTILAHHFDGRIEWLQARLDVLFDPSPATSRFQSLSVWSGHTEPVQKIIRSVSGKTLVSRTSGGECMLWKHRRSSEGSQLVQGSEIRDQGPILKMCILEKMHLVVLLLPDVISLWDTRKPKAVLLARQRYSLEGQPLCLILLPKVAAGVGFVHVTAISSEMKGIAWEIRGSRQPALPEDITKDDQASLSEFCRFTLKKGDDLAFVIAVDPAGSKPTISGFLDTFARDVAISYAHSGYLHSWTAKVDVENRQVDWLLRSSIDTGIARPSLASGSSIRKAALIDSDRTELTIWDTREAQLEFKSIFEEPVTDLDWTSTPDNQSVLAIGFAHRVRLLCQLRYDYLDARPAWTPVRDISISELTPFPIGDSVWTSHGDLVVGAGNQLFVSDGKLEVADSLVADLRLSDHLKPHSVDLFAVVTRLNGPLPVFHPQFIAQCILRGKLALVQRILVALYQKLKFYTEGDGIDSFLDLQPGDFLHGDTNDLANGLHLSYTDLTNDGIMDNAVNEMVAASLNEKLTMVTIPQITSQEQFHLADIVECVATVEKHRRSLDDNASRFLLFFRQYLLHRSRRHPTMATVPWREIIWGYHSDSQDILIDLVSRQHSGGMQWEHARECGMFMWIKDLTTLRKQFEVIARNQYTRTDEKNPVDCSLFYLALRKKNVLLGLWRMAGWNPEQRATQKLLGNDFQEPRWRTAALKNAYVLLGRHRYEYAAAFFLLADSPRDAVNVCVDRIGDLQLGIAIARVYEGDDGPLIRDLLEERILPQAAAEGNRWLATWAFWMLKRRDMAVRALISPIHTLLERAESPGLQAKMYLTDDPALVILYEYLRGQTLQTLRGALKVSSRLEWDFIIHTARLYDRMGCDLLALDLVYNWEFLRHPIAKPQESRFEEIPDPRKMLRRRSSLVVADLPSPKVPSEIRTGGTKPPPPSVFEEPDASSLLANFGY